MNEHRDRFQVVRDGEEIEVFNHVSVSTHHYVNSVNGYESYNDEADVVKGDMGVGPQPDAVTPRIAELLGHEFRIDVEQLGIEVIDPDSDEVDVL